MSDAGSERGGSRRGYEQGDGKVRDFGNWERKGPLSPSVAAAAGAAAGAGAGPGMREPSRPRSNDGPQFRRASPAWGEGQSQEGSRPPRREFQERPVVERAPTAADQDNQWRSKMKPDAPAKSPTPTRETSSPSSPAAPAAPAPPTTRPRLNLAKRTVSEAEPTASSQSADSKASPFGAARPIDTSAKEREIEERKQAAAKERKEAEEKARAEKAEERRLAKEQAKAAKPSSAQNGRQSEGAEGQQKPNFEILQREAEEAEDEETENPVENGGAAGDKEVKPQEIVRDIPAGKSGGATWRKNSEQENQPTPTADGLEEEGWSTVSKPQKKGRGGNSAARAIAS